MIKKLYHWFHIRQNAQAFKETSGLDLLVQGGIPLNQRETPV